MGWVGYPEFRYGLCFYYFASEAFHGFFSFQFSFILPFLPILVYDNDIAISL